MGSHASDCLIKEKNGRSKKKKTVEDRSTKLHSRALFALRMQALIMFDVPFSHYLVCSSVVRVKSSAKDQHGKTLKRGRQHNSAACIRWADSASCLLRSECRLIFEQALVTILYDGVVTIGRASFLLSPFIVKLQMRGLHNETSL